VVSAKKLFSDLSTSEYNKKRVASINHKLDLRDTHNSLMIREV
jgi:hypothetical protein